MISLTPLEIMLQNHKKCSFPACSYWNMHWSPKYHMTESKYSERPPSSLANLAQIVMWSVRRQEIQLKLYFKFKFFLCFRGNKAWCSNHKIIFNTEKYSFKYLYLKQKQISTWSLPKMVVYTSKKLQKGCIEKNPLHHMEIPIDTQKVTWEKVMILENLY